MSALVDMNIYVHMHYNPSRDRTAAFIHVVVVVVVQWELQNCAIILKLNCPYLLLSPQHTFLFHNGITIKLGRCAAAACRLQEGGSATRMLRLAWQWNLAKKLSSSPLHSTDHEQPKLVYDIIELQDFFRWAV